MKATGTLVRRRLLSYLEMASIYELSNQDELSDGIKAVMSEGKKILTGLTQNRYSPKSEEEMLETYAFLRESK